VLFFPPNENVVLLELDLFEKKLIAKGIIKLSEKMLIIKMFTPKM
jgi:hypothetical protein